MNTNIKILAFVPFALGVCISCWAQAVTDPKSVLSPAAPDFTPAATAEISSIDEPSSATWSPDGKSIAYVSYGSGVGNIWIMDVASGQTRLLAPEERRQREPRWSPDGKRILFVADEVGDEIFDVFVVDVATGKVQNVTKTPDHAEQCMSRLHQAWLKSRDGKFMIPALVWIPPNLKRDGSHPAVVEIHGGPTDQTRPYLLTYIQVLATRGYLVISPNYRGSTGYDRNFQLANIKDSGGGDLSDVEAAADWLIDTGYVDPRKVAAYGASNGAYLTLLALGKNPRKWAAGVALYPMVDFHTSYASEAPWIQAYDRALMGDPVKDAALWKDRSPLTHARHIVAPVLMTAGANDPRCPPEQARQMERAIRANGSDVDLKIFGEQGHGAEQTDAYIDENELVVQFLDKHLRSKR